MNQLKRILIATIALTLSWASTAQSSYPDRGVRMIVTWPAGSPLDVAVRAVSQGITEKLKQPVIVDNRPGANGLIGTDIGVRSPADGYTIISGNVETLAINPHVYANIKYDPMKDLEPVAMLGKLPLVLMVRSELAASTGNELVQLARSKPGKLTYGSWGVGSVGHLGIAMAEQSAGVDMLHVPFQGAAPALSALVGNQIDMMLFTVPYAEQQQKAGKVKLIGASSGARSSVYPHVATLNEQGFRNVNAEQWVGFFVPKNTPQNIKDILSKDISSYVASSAGQKTLREIGFDPVIATPAEMAVMVKADYERWGKLIKDKSVQVK
ncbi:MAG: tripartite tricarboxylate transporter substrate binding protein [Pseudomonadota bacterium]